MSAGDIILFSFGNIRRRKARAALTSIGVAIGIAAMISLLSIAQGLQTSVERDLRNGLDTDILIVTSSSSRFPLYVDDNKTIENISQVSLTAPVVRCQGYVNANGSTIETTIYGVDIVKFREIYSNSFVAQQGTIPLRPPDDITIIGASVSDPGQNGTIFAQAGDFVQLLRAIDTDGAAIGQSYDGVVSAVLKETGTPGSAGLSDSAVYIPIEQAIAFIGRDTCSMIIVKLQDDEQATIDSAAASIRDAFDGHVQVTSYKSINAVVSQVFSTIDLFLVSVAGISLLVAGIGIMNVMLMSLIERTREIGTLKALGMKNRTVLSIFLCEAGIIGLIGGTVGAVSGLALAHLVSGLLNNSSILADVSGAYKGITIIPEMSPIMFFGAIVFGALISVAFAIYPAWRSSRLSPMQALKRE